MKKMRPILSLIILWATLNGFSFAHSCDAKDGVIYNERITIGRFSGSLFNCGKEIEPYTPLLIEDSISYDNHLGYNGSFNSNSRMFLKNLNVQVKNGKKPRLSTNKKWGCCFAGLLGSIVFMFPAYLIDWTIQIDEYGFMGGGMEMNVGAYVGVAVGSAIGVLLVGNSGNLRGSIGMAFLGSTLGSCVSALAVYGGFKADSPFLFCGGILMTFTLPSILATWFFNKSARYKSPTGTKNALLNFSKDGLRIGVPLINAQPIYDFGKTGKMFLKMELNFMTIEL